MRLPVLPLVVGWALCGPALAVPPTVTNVAGDWTIARTSEWPDACSLSLRKGETIGGHEVKLKHGCAKAFKWAGEITAWRIVQPNELVLQDALRHGVIHFTRGEHEDWVGPGPDGQDYVITRDRPERPSKRKSR